jgi:RNA polymerase sigma factor (sigma-70 family)
VTVFVDNRPLLMAFRRGERSALETVYWHYVDGVESFVRRGFTVGDTRVRGLTDPDVAEVVQETFMRAFTAGARASYDGLRPYRPYLLRIARNLLVDRARLAGRLRLGDDEGLADQLEDAAEPADAALERVELADAARAFVEGLDAASRDFVRLRFEQGASQDAVAGELGITRRRVRTLEKRIRADLEQHLQRAGLGSDLAAFAHETSGRP